MGVNSDDRSIEALQSSLQRLILATIGVVGKRPFLRYAVMRGSVLNVWKGTGDGSPHSKVVAPTPQGFPSALR